MNSEHVVVTPGVITTITLDRPDRRNALSAAMLDDLQFALANVSDARCVLLQGEGSHFCAGADFGDVAAGAAEGVRYGAAFESLLVSIESCPLPVVAKVQGAALGAGCQLLAACDLAVAADDATIGVPSARLGLVLDLEKIQRMVQVFAAPVVREMLLSGRSFTGAEAAARGFVARAVPAAELDAAAARLCEDVAMCAPLSVRASKKGIRGILDHGSLERGVHGSIFEAQDARALTALTSADLAEGLAALKERRAPKFEGH